MADWVTISSLATAGGLRNASAGPAVLHGWWLTEHAGEADPPPLDEMHRLTRDIFVPSAGRVWNVDRPAPR